MDVLVDVASVLAAAAVASAASASSAPAAPPPSPAPLAPVFSSPDRSRLSEEERWSIVALTKFGVKKKDVASHLSVDRKTVRRVLHRFEAKGTPRSGSRSGRPRITNEEIDTAIAFTAHVDKFTSPKQIRRKLFLDISARTVDGESFCGQTWVRRPKGEALNPAFTIHKTAHPVKVNVWACFCAAGVGYTYIFNENMDAKLMKRILSENLVPSAELHFDTDPPEQWHLLHDNDKKFKSNIVTELLHNKGVSTLDFPPYSPDLNPIENLWSVVAKAVEVYACADVLTLQDAVEAEWEKVNENKKLLRNLAHSMPDRISAVIAAEGWHTKF